jgi:hypothetical protein
VLSLGPLVNRCLKEAVESHEFAKGGGKTPDLVLKPEFYCRIMDDIPTPTINLNEIGVIAVQLR